MAQAYSEDQLVEQPAMRLLATLGWQVLSAAEETFGLGGTLGRETKGETVLLLRLRTSLERLNPSLPPEALSQAIDQLVRDHSAMSLAAANREVYGLLKDGIEVSLSQIPGVEGRNRSGFASSIGRTLPPMTS